jgi:hypothetical protein
MLGIFENRHRLCQSETSLIAQPEEIWTNGDDGRIRASKGPEIPIYRVLIVGERVSIGGRIKPRRKFSISEIGGVLA